MTATLMESLPDRRRICVLLRADGWSYDEIADYLGISFRQVRYEIEHAIDQFPGLLDHRRGQNQNRIMRLVYLMGLSDAGVPVSEMPDMLDSLVERSHWLRARMQERARRTAHV